MRKLLAKVSLIMMVFSSLMTNAQPTFDIVCLELTVNGETSVIGLTANALEETQSQLAAQGISSVVVECEDLELPDGFPFDWDGDAIEIGDGGEEIIFDDIVCLEVTANGETSVIGLTTNALEETQSQLAAQGISSVVVECEDLELPDGFPFDWDGESSEIGAGGEEIIFDDIVCLEVTANGETSVIGMTANFVEETQSQLAAQGISSVVVECEGLEFPDGFPFDWDGGSIEIGDGGEEIIFDDIVCLEVTANGETSVIGLTANVLEETQNQLTAQGISSVVVECEDLEFPDNGGNIKWNDAPSLETVVVGQVNLNTIFDTFNTNSYIQKNTSEGIDQSNNQSTDLSITKKWKSSTIDEGIQIENFKLFPNPVKSADMVSVKFNSSLNEKIMLRVMNQLGQMVHQKELSSYRGNNTFNLEIATLEAGLYFVSLSNGQKLNAMQKMMIIK